MCADHVAVPALVPGVRGLDGAVAPGLRNARGRAQVAGGRARLEHCHADAIGASALRPLPPLGRAVLHQGAQHKSKPSCMMLTCYLCVLMSTRAMHACKILHLLRMCNFSDGCS